MAYARVSRQWADQTICTVEVGCKESFPDSVAEVVAAVLRLDRETDAEDAEAGE